MAGILKVDTLQSDSNLALKIATANVAFIDSNGLNVVGGNLTIGATQFAEGGQIQTAGIADDAVTSDKILSVANTKLSGVIEVSQLADTLNFASKTVTLPAGVGGKVLQMIAVDLTNTQVTNTSVNLSTPIWGSTTITPTTINNNIVVFVSGSCQYAEACLGESQAYITYSATGVSEAIASLITSGNETSSIRTYDSFGIIGKVTTTTTNTYTIRIRINGKDVNSTGRATNWNNGRLIIMEVAA